MAAPLLDVNRPETAQAVGLELAATTSALSARLADVAIVDLLTLEQQVEDRRQLGEAMRRVELFFEPLISMAHKLWKALTERRRAILAPLEALDARKRGAISEYKAQEDRARREQARELEAAERRARETDAAAEAAALEASGDAASAAAVIEEAISAAPPVVALADPTRAIDGLSFVRRWYWKFAGGPAEVKDTPPDVLARALAKLPAEFLMVDEKKIGAYARSMKASGAIPGVEIYYRDEPVRR